MNNQAERWERRMMRQAGLHLWNLRIHTDGREKCRPVLRLCVLSEIMGGWMLLRVLVYLNIFINTIIDSALTLCDKAFYKGIAYFILSYRSFGRIKCSKCHKQLENQLRHIFQNSDLRNVICRLLNILDIWAIPFWMTKLQIIRIQLNIF